MRLKRLELSGFKSFAKTTALEFPHSISAVVGPNGSGKSNVADVIRWVLGEQSLKSLRGKRGEDLIFVGTASAPRLSKASALLVFDNSAHEFPLEFEEVSIGRRVYRDGANDYLLNGSAARLKDIIELLARVGFGSSQHHIIGQGEADRILYASPKERRDMIEDALGLKIFQLKRAEAERKLERTEENMRQVSSLQKEIEPHLKFLKTQAEKYEIASKLRGELAEILKEYLSKKLATIVANLKKLSEKKSKPEREFLKIEREIKATRAKVEKADLPEAKISLEDKAFEEKLQKTREEQMKTLREFGKLEGMIALEEQSAKGASETVISKDEAENILKSVLGRLDAMAGEGVLENIKKGILELKEQVSVFLRNLSGRGRETASSLALHKEEFSKLKVRLDSLKTESERLARAYEEKIKEAKREAEETRLAEKRVYQLELEAAKLKDDLRSLELEEEKIKLAREEYERELEEARPYFGEASLQGGDVFHSDEAAGLFRKKIERAKIKLEEAGGIDPAVLKEYKEVANRDEFLSKELADLIKSAGDLRQMMQELGERLERDFKEGVAKINKEFQKFFETMFGGGKAELKVITRLIHKKHKEEKQMAEEESEEDGGEEGVDISVDLPRKRIKSLDVLSGGERALTSIALLFAMSAVHPPPFLVLDETDAALDEANSDRYAKMLENLSKTTQLIVITHNRTTMKCAGVLYGVTMGSDGISKLLSLKFEEAGALVT
ncbi:MAG: hypothetical protein Q8R12_03620 [bacterium]|nr:hypothetical protein [bacterium]